MTSSKQIKNSKKTKDGIEELYQNIGQPKFQKPPKNPNGTFKTIIWTIVFGFIAGFSGAVVLILLSPNIPFLDQYLTNYDSTTTQIITTNVNQNVDQEAINLLINKISPQVVTIFQAKDKSQEEGINLVYKAGESLGLGTILTADGWVITNQEVVSNLAGDLVVITEDKKILEVDNIILDPLTNLTLLKAKGENLTAVEFVDEDNLYLTQEVFSLARPDHNQNSLFFSHLQDLNSPGPGNGDQLLNSSEEVTSFLLLNDSPNSSFKGSALFNLDQKVVGFSTPSQDNKINNFISVSYLNSSIGPFLKNGNISRPYLGIHYLDIRSAVNLPKSLSQDLGKGILISGAEEKVAVIESSPADKAGLQAGDIILKIGDTEIENKEHFNKLIMESVPDKTLEFTISRSGLEKVIPVVMGEIE